MAYKDPNDPRARESRRKHYRKNKEQYYKNNVIKKQKMREYLYSVKDVPCNDCGVKYPSYVMEFDHRDPDKKDGDISIFVMRQSWRLLKEEVSKCDIVCANCHRIRTAKLLGYKNYRLGVTEALLSPKQ